MNEHFNVISVAKITLKFLMTDESERQKTISEFITEESIRAEQTYKFLYKIFSVVTDVYKQKPVVIDADDLQADPGLVLSLNLNQGEILTKLKLFLYYSAEVIEIYYSTRYRFYVCIFRRYSEGIL